MRGEKAMIIVGYFNWLGTQEQLDEYVSAVKKAYEKTPGTKFLGKYAPVTKIYNWALFAEVKDWATWEKVNESFHYTRDFKTMPNFVYDFFA
jgi:hypothetical protein